MSASGKNNIALVKPLAAKPYAFSSGRIEVDLRLDSTTQTTPNAAVIFAYQDSSNFRFAELRPGRILFGQKGRLGGSAAMSKSKSVKIKRGVTYTLRLDLRANGTMQIYVEDKLVATYRFKKATAGAVGLSSYKIRGYFDNMHVWSSAAF